MPYLATSATDPRKEMCLPTCRMNEQNIVDLKFTLHFFSHLHHHFQTLFEHVVIQNCISLNWVAVTDYPSWRNQGLVQVLLLQRLFSSINSCIRLPYTQVQRKLKVSLITFSPPSSNPSLHSYQQGKFSCVFPILFERCVIFVPC